MKAVVHNWGQDDMVAIALRSLARARSEEGLAHHPQHRPLNDFRVSLSISLLNPELCTVRIGNELRITLADEFFIEASARTM